MREKCARICRVLQFLLTLYTKLLEDRKAPQLSDQKRCCICIVNRLQKSLPRVEAARIQGFNSETFPSKQAILCLNQLLRLCQHWGIIPKGQKQSTLSYSLFFATNGSSKVQL